MKLYHLKTNSGRDAANQIVVEELNNGGRVVFYSYGRPIAANEPGEGFVLDSRYWDYSRTTLRYLCQFLNVRNKAEIEKNIKAGTYKLADLSNL